MRVAVQEAQPSVDENFENLLTQIEEKNSPQEGGETESNEEGGPGGVSNQEGGATGEPVPDSDEEKTVPQKPKNVCTFVKGGQTWDVEDDAEFTFKADKGEVTKTLSQLRDAAAGDIAIRNRMREVAEERKSLHKPIKKFIGLSKTDPLGALRIIAEQAKQVDENFTYEGFIQELAKQGRNLSSMGEEEQKAYKLSQELEELKAENQLQSDEVKERERRKEFLEKTRLSEQECKYMGEQILADETLSEKIETQEDLDNMIGLLAVETALQKKAFRLWKEINPDLVDEDIKSPLVYEVTRQMRQNPDFSDDDFKDIIKSVMVGTKRKKAVQALGRKRRGDTRSGYSRPYRQSKDNFQTLMEQIEKKKNKN